MNLRATFVRSSSSLLGMLVLAGCAVTSGQRGRYLEQIEPGTLTNLTAYRAGNTLEIRFPLRGKDAFAHASWPAPPGDAAGYHHQFAVLTFEKEEHARRRTIIKRGNRLPVRDAEQWQQLVQRVFRGLAPDQPNHGVLMLVQNQEVVVFKDRNDKLQGVKLENKPREVTLDHTFNDTDFSRKALQLLEASVNRLDPGQRQFLFVNREDPAFVLIDLDERLTVFLSYPADLEPRRTEMPGWFVLRALNSLVIKSFVLTAIKNPFTLVSRGLWHIGNSGATMLESGSARSADILPPVAAGPEMDRTAWEQDLDHLVSSRRHRGRVEWFIDGEQFFPALIQSIASAERAIDVLVFIFDTDDYAVRIADLLKERSSKVRVRVLMDEMGSLFAGKSHPHSPVPPTFQYPGSIQSYLESGARVQVRTTANPWLTADHRKCIIIDGRQAYVGGMNIGREYRYEWHDLMVRLTGPVVGPLEKDFRKAWAHAGPLGDYAYAWISLFGRAPRRKLEIADGIDIRPLRTSTGKEEIYRAQVAAIQRAQRYIYLENAYFDDDTILRELIRARQRGVDVRVVLPAENDIGIMQTSNLVMANEMIRNGVRVYAYPRMTHVKAAIYDGWACVGSANFNKMSLRICQELDVAFSDPATVDHLKQDLFEKDFSQSRELKSPVPLSWLDSLVKAFADQL